MPLSLDGTGSITGIGTFNFSDEIIHVGDTNTKIRFPANDVISFETAGSERLRIISSGQIGIGTDAPAHALDIQGSSGSFTKLALSNQTMNTSKYEIIFGDQGQVNHVVAANREITFATNNTERLRIKSDGTVGINTTGNFGNIALSIYGDDVGEGTAQGQLIFKDNAAYNFVQGSCYI